MTTALPMGTNQQLPEPAGVVVVEHAANPAVDVNLTAFLITTQGRVRGDTDMVFFNQPDGPEGAATFLPPTVGPTAVTHRLAFDLGRLPAGIERIVVTLTEDGGAGFAAVAGLTARIEVAGAPVVELPPPSFTDERGIMVAEVYVRNGQHKVRSIWQGYAGGLAALAAAHGVETDDSPAAPALTGQATLPIPPLASTPPPPPPPPPPPTPTTGINLQKVSGAVNLRKGDRPVVMEKTPLITASVSWRSGTDYDVYALVWTTDGRQTDVAMFGAEGVPVLQEFLGVRHHGDIQRPEREPRARRGWGRKRDEAPPPPQQTEQTETIDIRLSPEVVAVVPVAYSAQANGSGSFRRYQVSLLIDNGAGTAITVSAANANDDDGIFTCVPGIIRNSPDGVVVEPVELYSAPGSENRPRLRLDADGQVVVEMDTGPENDFK